MKVPYKFRFSQRRVHGFTLMEALLALLVFSVAVVSLVEAINRMGEAAAEGRRERNIQARMESLLLEATRMSSTEGPDLRAFAAEEKKVEEEGVSYLIKMEPLDLQNADGQTLTDLKKATVVARWNDGTGAQELEAETWVWPPLFAPEKKR